MNLKRLKELLMLGEGQTIEFKPIYHPDRVGKQICAFLNSGGGCIVCGVKDDTSIVGLDTKHELRDIEKELAQAISPSAFFSVERTEIERKDILVIEVPAGKDVPYSYRNDIFIRTGATTKKADIDTIRDMVLRRETEPERWERRFSSAEPGVDLDNGEVNALAQAITKTGRLLLRDAQDLNKVLEDVAVLKYGRLTNAGDVLFANNPALRHPQVRVRATCFTSDKTDNTYQDIKNFEGPLAQVLEEAYNFILRNTPTKAHFKKDALARSDSPVYPADAVREGLINAFVHRDYADFSGGISINIYPDSLEIRNSGELPDGVTPASLVKGHISILRNPDIAHVIYLRGMMEKIGRGSLLIQKGCKEEGLPKPEWKSDKTTGVTLTFHAPEMQKTAMGKKAAGTKSGPSRDQVGTKSGLSPEEVKILELCRTESSLADIMAAFGRSNRTKFRDQFIKPLLENGFVEMTIPDKPNSRLQKYRITEQGKNLLQNAGV
jgi:ATP-dependent DNA helicase RecG